MVKRGTRLPRYRKYSLSQFDSDDSDSGGDSDDGDNNFGFSFHSDDDGNNFGSSFRAGFIEKQYDQIPLCERLSGNKRDGAALEHASTPKRARGSATDAIALEAPRGSTPSPGVFATRAEPPPNPASSAEDENTNYRNTGTKKKEATKPTLAEQMADPEYDENGNLAKDDPEFKKEMDALRRSLRREELERQRHCRDKIGFFMKYRFCTVDQLTAMANAQGKNVDPDLVHFLTKTPVQSESESGSESEDESEYESEYESEL